VSDGRHLTSEPRARASVPSGRRLQTKADPAAESAGAQPQGLLALQSAIGNRRFSKLVAARSGASVQRQGIDEPQPKQPSVEVRKEGDAEVVAVQGIAAYRVTSKTPGGLRRRSSTGSYTRLKGKEYSRGGNSVSWRFSIALSYEDEVSVAPIAAGIAQLEKHLPSVEIAAFAERSSPPGTTGASTTPGAPQPLAGSTPPEIGGTTMPPWLALAARGLLQTPAAGPSQSPTPPPPRTDYLPAPSELFPQLLNGPPGKPGDYEKFRDAARELHAKGQYLHLSEAELIALRAYSGEYYHLMNKEGLRAGAAMDPRYKPLISEAWTALLKLPPSDKKSTTRWESMHPDHLYPNPSGQFVDPAFRSTSIGQPPQQLKGLTFQFVTGSSGRQLGPVAVHGSENEVLYPPGTTYNYERPGGGPIVRVSEVEGAPPQVPSHMFYLERPSEAAPTTARDVRSNTPASVPLAAPRPELKGMDRPAKADAAATGALMAVNAGLDLLNEHVQGKAVSAEKKRLQPEIDALRQRTTKGVWLHYLYTTVEAHPDSAIVPGPKFESLTVVEGGRNDRTTPAVALPGHQKGRYQSEWLPPLNTSDLKYQLDEAWHRYNVYRKAGERLSQEGMVGRFLRERTGTLDIAPIYDARAHLASAKTALEQGRAEDARASIQSAEKLLDEMRARFTAYGVKWD
jgi:hypothetical protein